MTHFTLFFEFALPGHPRRFARLAYRPAVDQPDVMA
jgi:hypothetical protein